MINIDPFKLANALLDEANRLVNNSDPGSPTQFAIQMTASQVCAALATAILKAATEHVR